MSTSAARDDNSDGFGTSRSGPEIELDQVVEGDLIASRNYRFSRIGETVPIKSQPDFTYNSENPPSQPLVVSQRFHLLFIAHNNGFYVARTKEVMASAEKIKDEGSGPSIQELSLVDVHIGKVSILALSTSDSLLAACMANQIHFFSLSALHHKEQKHSFSVSLDDSVYIKDMRWARKAERDYVVLSSSGKLYRGSGQGSLVDIMNNVDAVEWSANGKFIAVARMNILSIMSSDFIKKFNFSLSPETLKVDSIRWFRKDSLVVGCFDVNNDSEEANYFVQVITSQDKEITDDASSKPIVLSFSDIFLDFQSNTVPHASGPNLFLSYLDSYELAFVANRKNLSQHVVLMGWFLKDRTNESSVIELSNDAWCAHIESQGNDDDNLVLALSVDKVPQNDESKFILGEEEREVSPCCILLCLTIDGKLSVFYFSSAAGASVSCKVLDESVGKQDSCQEGLLENGLSEISSLEVKVEKVEENFVVEESNDTNRKKPYIGRGVENVTEVNQPHSSSQINKSRGESGFEIQKQKPLVDFETLEGVDQQKFPVIMVNQDRVLQQAIPAENLHLELVQSSYSRLEDPGIIAGNARQVKAEAFAEVKSRSDSFSGKVLTDLSSQSVTENLQECASVAFLGKTAITDEEIASSFFSSSGKATLKNSDAKSSLTSTGTSPIKSPGGLVQYPSKSQHTAVTTVPMNTSGQRAKMDLGNNATLPVFSSSLAQLQENFASRKSSKSHISEEKSTTPSGTGWPISEQNLSKQLSNVEEMTKKMDQLMEDIEGIGGFSDAIASQERSVLKLEAASWTLSEKCTMWRGTLGERLRDIQLLLDKTVQVMARKIYIKEIFKQATDSQYWDLWNCQKLSSELEVKRKHISEVNQDLIAQLLDLERHLNSTEINKFGESGGVQTNRRAMPSKHGKSRHAQSLHSLHNTMGAQLAAAEKLSACLSKQMAVLRIETPARKQNVKRELFETIGLTCDNSRSTEQASSTPPRKQLLITSFSLATKGQSKRNQNTHSKSSEPETLRRRRESLDQNWSTFEPLKTTVKRILLQEDREKRSITKSPFQVDKHCLKYQFQRESAVLQPSVSDKRATPIYQAKSIVIPGTQEKQSTERPSTSLFPWADGPTSSRMPVRSTEIFPALLQQSASTTTAGLNSAEDVHILSDGKSRSNLPLNKMSDSSFACDSSSVRQSEVFLHGSISMTRRNPAESVSLNKNSTENFTDEEIVLSKSTIKSEKPTLVMTQRSPSESDCSRIMSLSSTGAVASTPSSSGKIPCTNITTSKEHPVGAISSSSSLPFISSLPSSINVSSRMSSIPTLRGATSSFAISSAGFASSSQANTDADKKESQSQTLVSSSLALPSTLSFPTPKDNGISYNTPISLNGRSQSPESVPQPTLASFGSKRDGNFAMQTIPNSTLTIGENLKKMAGVSQPEPPSGTSDFKFGHTMVSTTPTELSGSLESHNQLNVSGILSPLPAVASNPKSEQPYLSGINSPSAIQNSGMPYGGKSESSDAVAHEDEMEEEAPEAAEISLGDLGGFGIGSVPNSNAVKPNPFGLGTLNKAAAPVSSSFTTAAPSGELFRPAAFSFHSPLPTQPSHLANISAFSSGFSPGSTNQVPPAGGFGQPAQIGLGQKALGSVLGTFGQSRQLGTGLPGNDIASPTGFGSGFSGMATGGFGGGFAGVAPAAGGFVSLTAGGGGGCGFATAGGGFAAAATAGDGFAGATSGGGFAGSGFGAFSNQQGAGGFSGFGSTSGSGRPPSDLFTQMRK